MPAFRHILVVGASGRLGREVVTGLVARDYTVRGTSRDPRRVPAPAEAVAARLRDPVSLHLACSGVDAVVMAAGSPLSLRPTPAHPGFRAIDAVGTQHLVRAALGARVRKLVYVSVFAPEGFEGGPYVEAHQEAAEAVRESGLDHVIIQPTGFFSTFDAYLPLARIGVMPEIGDGTARTNPIHERDLASIVVRALEEESGDLPVGGPEVLSRREIAEAAFAAVGRAPRLVQMPDALLRFNARAVRLVDRRLGELITFLDAVSRTDLVAPRRGVEQLSHYLHRRARRGNVKVAAATPFERREGVKE